MLTLDYIHMIWDYNYWGHHKLWDCLKTVSQEDFVAPIDYGIGSLHNHVVHTMWAEALWLARMQGNPPVQWLAEDFSDVTGIIDQWQKVEISWRTFITTLTVEKLNETFIANASSGGFDHKIGETLIHVVNHSTDHRAQMLRLIGDYGGETFEQDIIFYLREKQASQ